MRRFEEQTERRTNERIARFEQERSLLSRERDKGILATWAIGLRLESVTKERDDALSSVQDMESDVEIAVEAARTACEERDRVVEQLNIAKMERDNAVAEAQASKEERDRAVNAMQHVPERSGVDIQAIEQERDRAIQERDLGIGHAETMEEEVNRLRRELAQSEYVSKGQRKMARSRERESCHVAERWGVIKDIIGVAVGATFVGMGTGLLILYGPHYLSDPNASGIPISTGLMFVASGSMIIFDKILSPGTKKTATGILDLLLTRAGNIAGSGKQRAWNPMDFLRLS